ncbi:hypothetical protein K1719_041186 [Acacia pycnantha]|nr:hypothetical protein K1719_041186 [Acacia pycnantha]
MVELTNREGNEGIDSRVPIMNQILKELRNPSVNMIGLCGLGGVGKTTIAKEVAKNQNIFKKVIMATVSQELNIEKIQGVTSKVRNIGIILFIEQLTPLIWDDQLPHNSFNNLKGLVVKSCGFVKLVPLHVLKSLNNLEEVEVKSCGMLEILFDFEDLNYKEMDSSSIVVPLKKLKLFDLPKLKNVWSNNAKEMSPSQV